MHEPSTSVAGTLWVTALGAGAGVALNRLQAVVLGVPLEIVPAAFIGALVPVLLLEREGFGMALRRWLGSVLFSLSLTTITLLVMDWRPEYAWGVAAGLAMFARWLFTSAIGQVGGIVERIAAAFGGPKSGGSQ